MLTSFRLIRISVLISVCAWSLLSSNAQTEKPAPSYPAHLPYSFANFVWWDDDELRALLKKRIPGLGNEIATTNAAEGKVRDALTALLKEKGITAVVQSEEPSLSSFQRPMENMVGIGDLETPLFQPSIVLSVLEPKVAVGQITVQSSVEAVSRAVEEEMKGSEGRPFTEGSQRFSLSRIDELIKRQGYFSEHVLFRRGSPYKLGDRFVVDVTVVIDAGPKYRVASITADGGPLLQGKDLSQFFAVHVGDEAGPVPFARLGPGLRGYYEQFGYADVRIKENPVLDREHATVAYSLNVDPGPIYYLRSLTVQKLNPEQEEKVRELLGMKPGDVFQQAKINDLYHKVANEPSLKGYSFGFGPKADKAAAVIDLSLSFFKQGDESSVTIR